MSKLTTEESIWEPGVAPIAVVMISLNEGHNLEAVLANLKGWAQEVFLIDSFSQDNTVDIALRHGVQVVQRRFEGFGDQWNFALKKLPITAQWTMKIDPDERLSQELKNNIVSSIESGSCDGIEFDRRWCLMSTPLPIHDRVLRVWRTGLCTFSEVSVNEHPMVNGKVKFVSGDMDHLDSPDLDHWIQKQNKYSSAEAIASFSAPELSVKPSLLGNSLERRMWFKHHFYSVPARYKLLFLYFFVYRGLWRGGLVGYHCARLWTEVYRWKELKILEIKITGHMPKQKLHGPGQPDPRVDTITRK